MAGPISLEELIAKKENENGLQKPKFLLKKERQQLALERRHAKVKTQSAPAPSSVSSSARSSNSRFKPYDTKRTLPGLDKDEFEKSYSQIMEKSRNKKFTFDWNVKDDTLATDDPIVQASLTHDPIRTYDMLQRKQNKWDDKHWSEKPLDQMKARDWRILKEDFEIIMKGSDLPKPLRSWKESPIPPALLTIIEKLHFKDPTPIQRASIPISLSKRDIIGIAETGSGKTLAYLIPMLAKLLKLPRIDEYNKSEGPYGLILVPTRELAQQIESEFKKFLKFLPEIDVISIVGGKLIEKNIIDLQNKFIEIIIATPGRLNDCLENHFLALNQVKFLVLDECDKMIEMNFGDQVEKIIDYMNTNRQNMMFTATMTSDVEKLSRKYVNNPAIVNIGNVSSSEMQINDRIEQKFEFFSSNDDNKKLGKLTNILSNHHYNPPIIIFINYKDTGEYLFKKLSDQGFKVSFLHGTKSQDQRELAIKQLKEGKVDILIGTNVASRGIDINNVSLVINFQMTKKIDDYIHRIGRTGRAGNYGTAITFLNDENDSEIYNDLRKLLVKSGNRVPEELKKLTNKIQAIV